MNSCADVAVTTQVYFVMYDKACLVEIIPVGMSVEGIIHNKHNLPEVQERVHREQLHSGQAWWL